MSRVNDTGHVKGRLRLAWRIFLSSYSFASRTRFRVLSTLGDLFTYAKLCPFANRDLTCHSGQGFSQG